MNQFHRAAFHLVLVVFLSVVFCVTVVLAAIVFANELIADHWSRRRPRDKGLRYGV